MADESRDLAARRGRPLTEYGALFPGGRLWLSILWVAYGALAVLETIGNETWRVEATPYLDIALFIGLVPTIWRATRPKTQHEQNAEMRATVASLHGTPVEQDMLADAGLLDENGKLIDDAPPAWLDELTPERSKSGAGDLILRAISTGALVMLAWVGLLIGLAIIDWARGLVLRL